MGPLAVRVQLPDGARIHDVFHVSLVEPFHAPDGSTSRHEVPQPIDWLDGLPTYAADKILAHRLVTVGRRKIVEYLVKMQGDSAEAWTPRSSLLPHNSVLLSAYDLSMASSASPVPDLAVAPRTPPKPRPAPALATVQDVAEMTTGYSLRPGPRKRVLFDIDG